MKCKICSSQTKEKIIFTRSNDKKRLYFCKNCEFEFFSHNPKKKLTENKLNIYRLKKAGLELPHRIEEFKNGTNQSEIYIKRFINKKDIKTNILEIGCSFGYFLNSLKKRGFKNIYGLEINKICNKFVNNKLKIECFSELKELKKKSIFFDKIFLFYSFEYIYDPKKYLDELLSILTKNGKIYIITPNQNDVLKDLDIKSNFKNFFYDINSINYFSTKSLFRLAKKLKNINFSITTNQGYSLMNLFHWYLNKRPIKSRLVGGDDFVETLIKEIKKSNFKNKILANKLILIIKKMKNDYKELLSKYNYGNQIIFYIKKKV